MATLVDHLHQHTIAASNGEPAPAHRPDDGGSESDLSPSSLPRTDGPVCERAGRRASPTLTYSLAVVLLCTSGVLAVAAWRADTDQATQSLATLGAVAGLLGLCALGAGMVAEMLSAERARLRGERGA